MNNQGAGFKTSEWSEYAQCYDTLLNLRPYVEMINDVVKLLDMKDNQSLLDVGCGTGNLMHHVTSQSKHITVSGLDFCTNMLSIARQKCTSNGCFFCRTDLDRPLPFGDKTFDKVASVNVLYSLQSPLSALKEMYRLLKKNGVCVISTPKHEFDSGLILREHADSDLPLAYWQKPHTSPEREESLIRQAFSDEKIIRQMLSVATHNRRIACTRSFHFYSMEELELMFRKAGFKNTTLYTTYADQNILVEARS